MKSSTPKNYTLVMRHPIILLHHFAKCLFLLALSAVVFYILFSYENRLPLDFLHFVLLPMGILLMNYAFMKFILAVISYFNKIIIIVPEKIIIIDSTLLLQEDIEVIDIEKVVKIDVVRHGLLSAMFGFGHLIIEQQRNDVRAMHCIARPYEILQLIKQKTKYKEDISNEKKEK